MITYDQGRDAILAPFKAVWVDGLNYPAQYTDRNGGEPPTTQTPWARAIVRHVNGNQASLSCENGQARWGSQGTLYIQVFAPIGDGSKAAYDAAQALAQAYRGTRSDLVWFRNIRINEVGTSGAFEQVNFICEFQYDDIG